MALRLPVDCSQWDNGWCIMICSWEEWQAVRVSNSNKQFRLCVLWVDLTIDGKLCAIGHAGWIKKGGIHKVSHRFYFFVVQAHLPTTGVSVDTPNCVVDPP